MQSQLLNSSSSPTKMTDIKKSTRRARTRQDQQLYKISFPCFDPQTVRTIQIHLGVGQYHSQGQTIGTVYLKKPEKESLGQKEQSLLSFDITTTAVGNIEKIGGSFVQSQKVWKLIEGTKKCSLELMYIRECQHLISKQAITNTNVAGNSKKLSSYDKCPKCKKQITMYYQNQEQIITFENLLRANPQVSCQNVDELEWTIVLNQPFTSNTEIAKVGQRGLKLPFVGKATYLLGEGEKPVKNVLMKIRRGVCKHQKIIDNQCQICFQFINKEDIEQFNRYLFQFGPGGAEISKTRGQALRLQEQEFISSLLKKRKLILVLDLDNTILHSNEISELDWNLLPRLREFFVIPRFDKTEKTKQDYAIIKMRPYLKEFLLLISKYFEVYVYTKGSRVYAEGIGRWIRAQWAGQSSQNQIETWNEPHLTFLKDIECFQPYRLISRDQDSVVLKKSFQKILPTKTEYHIILDDRRDVWDNSPSWFFTRQYFYFCKRKTQEGEKIEYNDNFLDSTNQNFPYLQKLSEFYKIGRQNYPQKINEYKITLNENPDYFLLYAAHAMRRMHHIFFQQFKKSQQKIQSNKGEGEKDQIISLAYILHRSKQFLKGKKIRFFLPPNDQSLSAVRRCIKLGGMMIFGTQNPDYVIRGNYYMKYIKKWRKEKSQQKQTVFVKQTNPDKPQYINIGQQKGKESNQSPQKVSQQENISQKQQQQSHLLQKKEQTNFSAQVDQKSDFDLKIEQSIKQPELDYQIQLQQLERLHKAGIPVVSESWIHLSYEYTYRFKMQDFTLQNPFQQNLRHQHFDNIIAQTAQKIKIDINSHYSSENKANEKKKTIEGQGKSSSIKKTKQKQEQLFSPQKKETSIFRSEPQQNLKIQTLNQDKSC